MLAPEKGRHTRNRRRIGCPPEQAVALGQELTALGADWQIHLYGNTMHAFTNPQANDPGFGTVYNPLSDQRSWRILKDFLAEVLE